MTDWIVQAIFLVLRIIAPRPIRTRKNQRKLFHVHQLAGYSQSDGTHHNDSSAIPGNACGELDRFSRRRSSSDNGDISAGRGEFLRTQRRVTIRGAERQVGATLLGASHPFAVKVNGDYATACRFG